MGIAIFKATGNTGAITYDNSFTNPILWEVGTQGGVLERRYFVKMEDPLNEYATSCKIYAIDSSGAVETDWMSFAFDGSGGAGQYSSELEFTVPIGSEIPIWIRVDVPQALEQEPKTDIRVAIDYIRHEV